MKVSEVKKVTKITMNTQGSKKKPVEAHKWWLSDKAQIAEHLIDTAAFLKESQQYRYRQAAIYAKLYGNVSLFNFVGSQLNTIGGDPQNNQVDRPTFNLIQACVDTLVSKLGTDRPTPVFLTDNSDYKERNLAKKLNNFILGEFYQAKAYEKSMAVLRDALVEGTGCLKIYRTEDDKVGLDRTLLTDLLVDPNEAMYGEPRQMFHLKLVDRDVLIDKFPKFKERISQAATAYPNDSSNASRTVADQVMVVEGWHLPSGKDAKDGRHTIACTAGIISDEPYTKEKFPFVFLHFSPRLLGFWAQGLAEQLMGTQLEINSLLFTISKAIKLVGVPRVFIEQGSKVVKAHQNNDIGTIVTYSGTKPSYEVAPCVPQEMYAQLQRLIEYGFNQAGVSQLQSSAQKPAGLNSGEAIRSYDDISNDRFTSLQKVREQFFIDLAYQMIDEAIDIADDTGKYQTIYPNKNGVREIDLPNIELLKNPFVIQCFSMSSLPRDPAGRFAKITEMVQAGMISIKEGRRLLDYPDLEQVEKLANASEERILQILDEIVEEGKYTPPDPFMDLMTAKELVVQYINLYTSAKLEEEKCEMLRNFFSQIQTLMDVAAAPPPGAEALPPQAAPEPLPTSPLIPNAPQPVA